MAPRLKEFYRQEVLPALMKEFGHRNSMEAPRLDKIVLNVGLGEALQNPKALHPGRAALPRIRDFHGVSSKAFDGRGNYSLGLREQLIFPEIDYDKIDRIRGFQIVIVTTARTDEEGKRLLQLLGMPFSHN